jgi:hypothetical protein
MMEVVRKLSLRKKSMIEKMPMSKLSKELLRYGLENTTAVLSRSRSKNDECATPAPEDLDFSPPPLIAHKSVM